MLELMTNAESKGTLTDESVRSGVDKTMVSVVHLQFKDIYN
jgi:hypothetical protein